MSNANLDGIQVLGSNLSNVLNAFGSFQLLASNLLVEENLGKANREGLVEFEQDKWYPVLRWVSALERVGREFSDDMLRQAGLEVPKNAVFPPFVIDIDSALKSIDVAYHMNHAVNGEPMFSPTTGKMLEGIGHYAYTRVPNEKKILLTCDNPYPCAFDGGLIEAMAQRFEKSAHVTHDPKSCRKKGGQSCTYVVTWK